MIHISEPRFDGSMLDWFLSRAQGQADMDIEQQIMSMGRQIKESSFDIIDRELQRQPDKHPDYSSEQWDVVRRAIHSTGDIEFAQHFRFSDNALSSGIHALHHGCKIVTDISMIEAGISKARLKTFANSVHCFASDDVINQARAIDDTPGIMAMRKARNLEYLDGGIIAIGESAAALLEVMRMVQEREINPALIIGLPAGFVRSPETKSALQQLPGVPFITTLGSKGGPSVVVSTIHSLLIQARHHARGL